MKNLSYFKQYQELALTTSLNTTPAYRNGGIQLLVNVPSGTALTFYGCSTEDGTFRKLRRRTAVDTDFTAYEDCIITPDAEGIYPAPDEALCAPYLKIVAGSALTVEVISLGSSETRQTR